MKTIRENIVKIFTLLFSTLGIVVLVNCILFNRTTQFKYNMGLSTGLAMLMLIILLLVSKTYNRYIRNLNKNIKRAIDIFAFALILCMQIYIVSNAYFTSGWDCGKIVSSAMSLIDNPEGFDTIYFKRFPNNVLMLWIFKNIYFITSKFTSINFWLVLDMLNVLIMDIAIILTIKTCKEMFEENVYIICKILSVILLAFMPWILIPYSDTLSIFIPILIFYLYVKCTKEENKFIKALQLIGIGVFSIVGYQLKPTNIIICIAIFIAHFLCRINKKGEFIKAIEGLLLVICICTLTKVLYNKNIADIEVNSIHITDNEEYKVPITHFFMMGMQSKEVDGGTQYGSWCQEDYDITLPQKGKQNKIKANVSEIKNRLSNFGVLGYTKFLYNKMNWILCDGAFYYGGEGEFTLDILSEKSFEAQRVQNYFLYDGESYGTLANINQSVWILILLLGVFPIFNIRDRKVNIDIFTIQLAITGIVMFLLLFEARSRYLINHLPFFVLLSTYGFGKLDSMFNVLKKK